MCSCERKKRTKGKKQKRSPRQRVTFINGPTLRTSHQPPSSGELVFIIHTLLFLTVPIDFSGPETGKLNLLLPWTKTKGIHANAAQTAWLPWVSGLWNSFISCKRWLNNLLLFLSFSLCVRFQMQVRREDKRVWIGPCERM